MNPYHQVVFPFKDILNKTKRLATAAIDNLSEYLCAYI